MSELLQAKLLNLIKAKNPKTYIIAIVDEKGVAKVSSEGEKMDQIFLLKIIDVTLSEKLLKDCNNENL